MWRLLSGTTMPNGFHDVATLTAELQRELASLTARLLTADAWPRGEGFRDVIRPLVGCKLRCLAAESAGTGPSVPEASSTAA
jgi:hypothetical protein